MAAKNTSHWPITLTDGASSVLGIFLPLVLVRVLTPDQIGRYNIFFLYVTLAPALFLVAGFSNGLYLWGGKYPEGIVEVRQSWILQVLISCFFTFVGLALSYLFVLPIKIPILDLRLFLVCTPFLAAAGFIEDLLIARGSIWKGSAYASIYKVLRSVSLGLVAWFTHRVQWVFGVFIIGMAIRTAVGCAMLYGTGELGWKFSKARAMNALRYAAPVSLAALAGLAINQIDRMVLSFRIPPAQFAFYVVGCLSLPPIDIFETSVNRVLIPRMSRAFATGSLRDAAALYADGVSELYRLIFPAVVGLMVYADPIVRILFTERYMASIPFLRVFSISYLILAFPVTTVARARGDGKWILRTTIFFACLGIVLTWLAAGKWGAMGALVAVLTGQMGFRVYGLYYLSQSFKSPMSEFYPFRNLATQSAIALFAAAVSLLLRPHIHDPRFWFFTTGPLFTLIYFGATYAIHVRKLDSPDRPIRVLELSQTLGFGGLEQMVYAISHHLHQEWGFHVRVATYDEAPETRSLADKFHQSGIPLTRWKKSRGFSFRSVYRLIRIIFGERIRVVHAHDLGPLIYGTIVKLLTLGKVRLVLTVHTLLDIEQHSRHRRYYAFFLRFVDTVVAVSPAIHSGLRRLGVPEDRIVLVLNGVSFLDAPALAAGSAERLALRQKLQPGLAPELYTSRWAVSLARFHPGKGHDVLLKVWETLAQEARKEMVYLFVGQETHPTYAQELREKAAALPDGHRVLFVGPSEHPEEWLQCSDFFLSGSLHEGMPLAPLEAAGSGLPVLLSHIEGHAFLKPWAQYFDPQKPEEGARKVEEILLDLKTNEGAMSLEKNWQRAAPLRVQWSDEAMTSSYAAIFRKATLS